MLAEREEASDSIRATVSYYSLQADWKQVVTWAKNEMPGAIEHETTLVGVKAKVLIVPRIENGRKQLFYPPEMEITVMPRRLILNSKRRVVAMADLGGGWTGIQMREYRQPKPLDGLAEWVHKYLKV